MTNSNLGSLAQASTPIASPEWTRGDRFRKARTAAGFTQQELSERIDCSRRTINNFELDKIINPAPRYVDAWARHTGVSVAWIETGESA